MTFGFMQTELDQREVQGLLRKRRCVSSNSDGIIEVGGKHYLNFASNDYLGLSQHQQVQQAYVEGLALFGAGSGASSVVTGYSSEHQALEEDICAALNKPAALLFSSGFSANQAVCHALFPRTQHESQNHSGHILCDKLMHASFIQGALETPAKLSRFKHNDMHHARSLMDTLPPDSVVATEGVFSMDGDTGQVKNIVALIDKQSVEKKTRPYLMIDEAHALGVIGQSGFGSLDLPFDHPDFVDPKDVDIVMGTFGKALGTGGAFVAGSETFIEYMVNFSKHYIYSTAISGAQVRATRAALALVELGHEREILHGNIALFKDVSAKHNLAVMHSESAIQGVVLGCPKKALICSQKLATLGIWAPAIRTPTVPKHTDRIRITLSALHSENDIKALVDALALAVQA